MEDEEVGEIFSRSWFSDGEREGALFKDSEQMKRNREIEVAGTREMANFMARYFAAVRSSFFVTGEQE